MVAEALVVEHLLDRALMQTGEVGEVAVGEAARAYAETLDNLTLKPREIDSVVAQLCLLSRFCDAWAVASGDSAWQLAADRLLALAERIAPGACGRDDRPAGKHAAGGLSLIHI